MNVGYHESKRRWWPNLVADKPNGLLKHQTPTSDSLVVCRHDPNPEDPDGRPVHVFSIFSPLYVFGNEMLKEDPMDRRFFEIILGNRSQKPYFDIDISDPTIEESQGLELIHELKESILVDTRISETDILVFSSHGPGKLSYHVIVNNWCLPDYNSNKEYCGRIISRIPDSFMMKKFMDITMYKSIQQLRIFGNTKVGKERFKILDKHSLSIKDKDYRFKFMTILLNSLITNTGSCRILEYTALVQKVWTGSNEELTLEEIKIVEKLPFILDGTFEILDVKGRLIPLKRKTPSFCPICKRVHENENQFLTFSNDSNRIYINCHRKSGDNFEIWVNPDPKSSDLALAQTKSDIKEEQIPISKESVKTKSFLQGFLGKK